MTLDQKGGGLEGHLEINQFGQCWGYRLTSLRSRRVNKYEEGQQRFPPYEPKQPGGDVTGGVWRVILGSDGDFGTRHLIQNSQRSV